MNEGLRTESWTWGLRKGSIREAGLLRLQQGGSGRAVHEESRSPAGALVLLETETVTGARRTTATPAGLRSEGGRDRKPRPRPDSCCPSLTSAASHHPSSAKQAPSMPLEGSMQCCPRTPGVSHPQQGDPESPQPPTARVRLPQPSVPLENAGGLPAATVPASREQGQDWPGVALSQGLTLLSCHLLPAAPRRGHLVSEPMVPHHTSLTQRQKKQRRPFQ